MKILIIEDEQSLLKLLTAQLEKKGWEVISASEGYDALECLREKPDIVLLDILLPGLDGIEVLKVLRQSYSSDELPVIVISNFSDKSYQSETKELGISVYLVKENVSIDQIIAEVEMVAASKSTK